LTSFVLGLVSVSEFEDLGYYFKTDQDHNCEDITNWRYVIWFICYHHLHGCNTSGFKCNQQLFSDLISYCCAGSEINGGLSKMSPKLIRMSSKIQDMVAKKYLNECLFFFLYYNMLIKQYQLECFYISQAVDMASFRWFEECWSGLGLDLVYPCLGLNPLKILVLSWSQHTLVLVLTRSRFSWSWLQHYCKKLPR